MLLYPGRLGLGSRANDVDRQSRQCSLKCSSVMPLVRMAVLVIRTTAERRRSSPSLSRTMAPALLSPVTAATRRTQVDTSWSADYARHACRARRRALAGRPHPVRTRVMSHPWRTVLPMGDRFAWAFSDG